MKKTILLSIALSIMVTTGLPAWTQSPGDCLSHALTEKEGNDGAFNQYPSVDPYFSTIPASLDSLSSSASYDALFWALTGTISRPAEALSAATNANADAGIPGLVTPLIEHQALSILIDGASPSLQSTRQLVSTLYQGLDTGRTGWLSPEAVQILHLESNSVFAGIVTDSAAIFMLGTGLIGLVGFRRFSDIDWADQMTARQA